ncbi:hypothetical protein GOP47_0008658 [Adiantum capillus-veneris]|uniref:Uncharacterized protein n=1 Tax=Adiantum capillus-veneris TaxID=13818 RepID=A0A9D4UZQ7_ADICA|nr:hypothetical protein GOP47_0008658 [Adiantum capillus-veneris]
MSKGYAFNHSHISEVSRGASDSSPPSSQQQSPNGRQVAQAQNGDYGQGRVRHMSSRISALSPPHSSNSSDVLSPSGSNYQCDRDMYSNEINSCTYNDGKGKYHLQVSQSPGASSIESPDSTLAFSGPYLHNPAIDKGIKVENTTATALELGSLSFEHALKALSLSSGVKSLLITCAASLSEEKMDVAEQAMKDLRKSASVYGDPLERLAAYMSEGLVARLHASGSIIYKALKCREAPAIEVLSAMQKLYEICPYIQFAFMAANGAIAEAFKEEAMVHVFDFQIDQGTQWFSLIQALASRPGGPPCMCISTIDDPTAHSYPLGGMDAVKMRLASFASSLGVTLEFTIISSKLSDLQASMIGRKAGEALAINFALQLHHMPDESTDAGGTECQHEHIAFFGQVATVITVYAKFGFAEIRGIGWGWAGVIWLYDIVFYLPLDVINFAVRYALSGRAWDTLFERKVAFTKKKDFGKEVREAQWAHAQRTMNGLQLAEPPSTILADKGSYHDELAEIAEQAK